MASNAPAVPMSPEQQRAFTMYVALGPARTIPKLFDATRLTDLNVSLRLLQRWSNQFRWRELAKHTQSEVASAIIEETKPALVDLAMQDLESMAILKRRFHERVKIDPTKANLTDAERARAIDPDLDDYVAILKAEKAILADPAEATQTAVSRIGDKLSLTDEDVKRTLGELVISKYGLPNPLKVVTYEQDDENGSK